MPGRVSATERAKLFHFSFPLLFSLQLEGILKAPWIVLGKPAFASSPSWQLRALAYCLLPIVPSAIGVLCGQFLFFFFKLSYSDSAEIQGCPSLLLMKSKGDRREVFNRLNKFLNEKWMEMLSFF